VNKALRQRHNLNFLLDKTALTVKKTALTMKYALGQKVPAKMPGYP
jgi:hypothetical protein